MVSAPSQNYHEAAHLLPQLDRRGQEPVNNAMGYSLASLFGWKAHPYWLIPVVLVMSISRGVTMSPRIQVYKALACRSLSSDTGMNLSAALMDTQCGGAEVEAKSAQIQAAVVTTMSALSAISTGFWSRRGDKHGRKSILSAFLIGALLMEAVFVLVMRPQSIFGRHGEKLILVGPILEGLVGGLSTFNGVVHAHLHIGLYPPWITVHNIFHSSRHGVCGLGHRASGMVVSSTGWDVALNYLQFAGFFLPKIGYSDSFFYSSITLISITLLYVMFICPESLHLVPVIADNIQDEPLEFKSSPVMAAKNLISRFLTSLLSPILMFAPRRVPNSRRRNWSMPLVGMALFLYLVSTGVYSAKYLYARYVFKWNTAELGYYMSILWITRAFNLLVFLPIVIPFFKPKPTSTPGGNPNPHDIAAEIRFDRYLAAISVGVDGLADSLVALTASRSQAIFIALSCLSSFTSGGNPALHSLGAICLHACGFSSEVGALFGAMGVLSAIAHIISPSIYAITYSTSVANFPEAIFVLAAFLLFSGVVCLSRVRPSESEIAAVHSSTSGGSGRLSIDGGSQRRRHLSGSYDYDAIPTYEEGHRNSEGEEDDQDEPVTRNPQ